MKVSDDGVMITRRFFEALERLKELGTIRGLHTFTAAHGINYWNIRTVRDNERGSMLKPEWLRHLVIDYGVSPRWLLTGAGDMLPAMRESEERHKLALVIRDQQETIRRQQETIRRLTDGYGKTDP